MRLKREQEEQRRQRKEKRAALREKKKLDGLKDTICRTLVAEANTDEYTPRMKIYDIRDTTANVDGIILIGGFVGELIITFTCMLDYILSSPANQNFIFSTDMVETFLRDLLGGEDCPYPDAICTLSLAKPISELDCGDHYDAISKAAREAENMTDFGLKFLFEIQKDLVLS